MQQETFEEEPVGEAWNHRCCDDTVIMVTMTTFVMIMLPKQSADWDPNEFFPQRPHLSNTRSSQNTQVQDKNTNMPADFLPHLCRHVRTGTRRRLTQQRTGTRRCLTQQRNRKRPSSWCAHCLPSGSGLGSDTFLTFVLLIPLPGARSLTDYFSSRLREKTRHCWPNCFSFFPSI